MALTHAQAATRRHRIAEYVTANNATLGEAAEEFGVHHNTVGGACRQHGVKPRDPRPDPNRRQQIRDHHRQYGGSLRAIGRQLGMSHEYVRQSLLEATINEESS